MGKRSRKRDGAPAGPRTTPAPTATPARATPRAVSRRARLDELPPAPWSPFPLVELCVLIGIVLIAVGFLANSERGAVFVVTGIGLAGLAGLEQAAREHAAGFRSHTTLLSGAGAILLMVGVNLAGVPGIAALVVGALAFAVLVWRLRRAFRKRTGGLAFRA